MDRLTFEGNFCDISRCQNTPGGSFCEDGACPQRKVWERLKEYEDTGLTPEQIRRENHTLRLLSEEYDRQMEDLVINGPPGGIEPTGILALSLEEEK